MFITSHKCHMCSLITIELRHEHFLFLYGIIPNIFEENVRCFCVSLKYHRVSVDLPHLILKVDWVCCLLSQVHNFVIYYRILVANEVIFDLSWKKFLIYAFIIFWFFTDVIRNVLEYVNEIIKRSRLE